MKKTLILLVVVIFLLLVGVVVWLNKDLFGRKVSTLPVKLQTTDTLLVGSSGGQLEFTGKIKIYIPNDVIISQAYLSAQALERSSLDPALPEDAQYLAALRVDILPINKNSDEPLARETFRLDITTPLTTRQPSGQELLVLTPNSTGSNWAINGTAVTQPDGLSASFTVTDIGMFLLIREDELERLSF